MRILPAVALVVLMFGGTIEAQEFPVLNNTIARATLYRVGDLLSPESDFMGSLKKVTPAVHHELATVQGVKPFPISEVTILITLEDKKPNYLVVLKSQVKAADTTEFLKKLMVSIGVLTIDMRRSKRRANSFC